jgi:AraC-like DNA-binding protein
MAGPTVSAGFARGLLEFAVSKGADRQALSDRSGIRPEDLADQDNRIPLTHYMALMKAGQALCDMPALALRFCEETRFEELSIVGRICQSATTMGEALKQLNRYSRLVAEVHGLGVNERFALVRRDGEIWLQDQRPDPNSFPELTEAAFGRFICEMTRHYGDTPFVTAIHVTFPRPSYSAEYDRILKAPVTFEAEWNAMRIEPSWLALEIHAPNRYVFGIFNAHADDLLKSLETSKTTRGRLESLLIPLLHTGEPDMTAMAQQLGVSRPTLYRRLKAEGVSFEAVVDDLRHRMALTYLDGRKLSVNETAYLVGFSDPSAFSRAFKRWTGNSPSSRKES